MTYGEQLATETWQYRRNEILMRDGQKCCQCLNESILRHSDMAVVCDKSEYNVHNKFVSIVYEDINSKKTGTVSKFFNDYPNRSLIDFGNVIFYITEETNNMTYLMGVITKRAPFKLKYSDQQELVQQFETNFDSHSLILEKETIEWTMCSNLHVHHNFYQVGKLAWEYPDEALTTLCWKCHERLHQNCTIEVRDPSGKVIDHKEPCGRCHGAGWFPEYKHVQSGVCFECRGNRFA